MKSLFKLLALMVNNQSEETYLRRIDIIRDTFGDEIADYISDNMYWSQEGDTYVYFLMLDPADAVESCRYLLKQLV